MTTLNAFSRLQNEDFFLTQGETAAVVAEKASVRSPSDSVTFVGVRFDCQACG